MPSLSKEGEYTKLEIERFDGGRNTKDSPSRIGLTETPDSLNVVFDDQGSVATRNGSSTFNTSTAEIGSFAVDGHATYNGTMVVWAGGTMYRISGTTAVTVTSSQGQFTTGAKVAHGIYQQILFTSEGTSGPWRFEGNDSFYRMGIAIPGVATAVSNTPGANQVETGTYYYKVAYRNTHVVEGEPSSNTAALTIATTAAINVRSIPTGAGSQGVASRRLYRASVSAGPYRLITTLSDNVTSIYTDIVGASTWSAGTEPIDDGTAPTPFTTIRLHKERLFFDDSSDRTLLRWTEFENPFISEAESFQPLNKGDFSYITAIGVQNDLVTSFKQNEYWLTALNDPSDDTTWNHILGTSKLGITGPKAFYEGDGWILFAGRQSSKDGLGKFTGYYLLSGFEVQDVTTPILRTKTITTKIEPDLLLTPSALWDDIYMAGFNNKIYIATGITGSTTNDRIWWFDINRMADEDIGSWSLWSGIALNTLVVHEGALYGGASAATGKLFQLEKVSQYNDSGTAINSYYFTKEYGGEDQIESWVKDFRWLKLWYERLGAWIMNVRYRSDGDSGSGDLIEIDLTPGGSLWGTMVWGTDTWGSGRTDVETDHSLGTKLGRRIQLKFDNGNVAGRAFKVHRMRMLMNLRAERR